jgi:hypothetical protein
MRATLLIVAVIIAAAGIHRPGTAHAHTITATDCQQRAITQALTHAPPGATADEVRTLRHTCNRIAKRHATTHRIHTATRRCVNVRDSNMQPTVCHALARAAVAQNRDAWAWSPALHRLLGHESTWNPNAVNDASDACGMFQRLVKRSQAHPRGGRGCPWAFTVVGWQGRLRIEVVHASALVQSRDGLRYIADRPGYGTPERALAFWKRNGWY